MSLPFAIPAAIAGTRLLHDVPPGWPRLDLPGTLTASTGLFALVFGLARGDGWGDPVTVGALIGGALVLAAFVALERRVVHPLLP